MNTTAKLRAIIVLSVVALGLAALVKTPVRSVYPDGWNRPAALFEGYPICLPHRGSGPHTMECALGIATDDGFRYALDTERLGFAAADGIWGAARVRVQGSLAPNGPDGGTWERYDIAGVIRATAVEAL